MKILAWLIGQAPDINTPPPPPPVITGAPPRGFPSPDTIDADELDRPDDTGTIALDELYCLIDYVDAQGMQTRRRITLLKVARGPHAPLLTAICHERRALRTFRCDRIECFIDDDGVVTTCPDFFRDTLRIDLEDLASASTSVGAGDIAREIRAHLRPFLSVLVTAARCDGNFHDEELDAICQYAERELFNGSLGWKFRNQVTVEVLDELTPIIRKMRPHREYLPQCLERIADLPEDDYKRFVRALEHVIVADGVVVADELELINDLGNFLADVQAERERGWAGVGLQ